MTIKLWSRLLYIFRALGTEIFIFLPSCLFNTWLIAVINRVISLRNAWWIITYRHSSWLLVNKLWVIVISFYTFFWNSMPNGTYSLTFHIGIVIYIFYIWRLLLWFAKSDALLFIPRRYLLKESHMV